MEALVRYIAEALVDQPEQVKVTRTEGERAVVYELHVAPGEVGRVIGRRGRTAKAIRTVVKAAAAGAGKPVHVEIVETDG